MSTSMKSRYRPYLIRLLITALISLAFTILFNEGSYLLQREQYDRAPKTVQLVIPAGTAEKIAAGQAEPSITEEMVFVVGDTLEVKNEDSTNHQLGPLWVPAGGTAKMVMETANQYAYSCSFEPSRYLGLDVRQATTYMTRITALSIAAPTMTALVFIYSLLIFPLDRKERKAGKGVQTPPAGG
jgi:hypothetical protein